MSKSLITKNQYNISIQRFVLTIVGITMALTIFAQHNVYKISDELYPIYMRAYKARHTTLGIQIADTLYNKAVIKKDNKAQCLALTIPLLYYFTRNDQAKMEKALKVLQDKALKTGYIQYYYFGESNKINYLINKQHLAEALDYTNNILEYAKKNNHHYGVYTCYRCLGNINLQRNATTLAIKAFQQAYDYGKQYVPEQDYAVNCRNIAECYMFTEDYQEALTYIEKGQKSVKSQISQNHLLIDKCFILFMLGREKEFDTEYQKLIKSNGTIDPKNINNPNVIITPIYDVYFLKLLYDGKYAEAEKFGQNLSPEAQRMKLMAVYYNRIGDFKKAQDCLHKQYYLYKKSAENVSTDALNEMNARLNNQRLETEKRQIDYQNAQLELANMQLTLKNSSLELGRAKTAEHLSQLNADNYQLSFNNKKLEAKQLRDSLAMQKAKRDAKEKELETRNTLLRGMLIMAFIIIATTLIYTYKVRHITKKLKVSNHHLRNTIEELFIAKDKALQADKMKTMFIQNMSHEIRTPLNAIVGFSQILSEMGDALSEEEKKEMGENISSNSELLTTLINDILDITSLESGKYVMKMDKTEINKLCREALDTVRHRKAPNVELRFDTHIPESYTIQTDALRVKQVIINLLTNAEKNTTDGSITLSCSLLDNPGKLTFSVTDTGIGIPKEKRTEIFERFRKLDRYKQGSGLGLNICLMIAERLGGKIYIDDNYNNGARFVFTINIDGKEIISSQESKED